MTKKEALNILLAVSCCNLNMCEKCPWNNTYNCVSTSFSDVVETAINVFLNPKQKEMNISDIRIKKSFMNTTPKDKKINKCRNFWNTWHMQDRNIVVDHNNELIDGYIQYLVLKENNINTAKVIVCNHKEKYWKKNKQKTNIIPNYLHNKTTYIYGVHPDSKIKKERVWRVPDPWTGWENDLLPGDTILVHTKYGIAPIIITRIEWLDKCPINMRVKKVYKKLS